MVQNSNLLRCKYEVFPLPMLGRRRPYCEEVVLSKKITNIGSRAFYCCISLKSIEIPAGVIEVP